MTSWRVRASPSVIESTAYIALAPNFFQPLRKRVADTKHGFRHAADQIRSTSNLNVFDIGDCRPLQPPTEAREGGRSGQIWMTRATRGWFPLGPPARFLRRFSRSNFDPAVSGSESLFSSLSRRTG